MDPLAAFLERYGLTAVAQVADETMTHRHSGGDISGPFSDVLVGGDIFSTNWGGAIPADLTTISSAITGFYLDGSTGSIQTCGNIWVKGALSLDGLTGLFQSAITGRRVTITGGTPTTYAGSGTIHLYSGTADEEEEGLVKSGGAAGQLRSEVIAPARTNVGGHRVRQSTVIVYDHCTTCDAADAFVFAIQDAYWSDYLLYFTADGKFGFSSTVGGMEDLDTYLQWVGANNMAFYMGGHKVLDMTHDAANLSATTVQIQGQTVTFGANDSAVAGYRHVMVPNTA